MRNKLDINNIYKMLFIAISLLIISSCVKKNETIIVDDLVMGECFGLVKQFNLLKKDFFQQMEDPIDVAYVSKEMDIFYESTMLLREKSESCVFDLYDNYDEGQVAPKIKERMVGIVSDLGKYEAVIFTHLKKIDESNFEYELWALKKMLE